MERAIGRALLNWKLGCMEHAFTTWKLGWASQARAVELRRVEAAQADMRQVGGCGRRTPSPPACHPLSATCVALCPPLTRTSPAPRNTPRTPLCARSCLRQDITETLRCDTRQAVELTAKRRELAVQRHLARTLVAWRAGSLRAAFSALRVTHEEARQVRQAGRQREEAKQDAQTQAQRQRELLAERAGRRARTRLNTGEGEGGVEAVCKDEEREKVHTSLR